MCRWDSRKSLISIDSHVTSIRVCKGKISAPSDLVALLQARASFFIRCLQCFCNWEFLLSSNCNRPGDRFAHKVRLTSGSNVIRTFLSSSDWNAWIRKTRRVPFSISVRSLQVWRVMTRWKKDAKFSDPGVWKVAQGSKLSLHFSFTIIMINNTCSAEAFPASKFGHKNFSK